MSGATRDISDNEFDALVIERSRTVPVVVDLWAPWCGPCRQLTPVLERIAAERPADFELVKLNVDENPRVASMLGARSIPLVVAFRAGKPVSSFVGAQPAGAINKFIDGLAPSPADQKVVAAAAAETAGDLAQAEHLLHEAVQADPHHEAARLALAELLSGLNRNDEALDILQVLPSRGQDAVARLAAKIRLQLAADVDIDGLRQKCEAAPEDIESAIALGQVLANLGQFEEALDRLLAAVARDPGHADGAARRAMLDVFELLGPESPLTRDYRRRLARALH
ncbi:MAG: tetratricopeptide repeat protein [Pseudomonadota bacterium]